MFKKKKHGALKALKSLAPSTKVRSKCEFTFCVESIEDVALEAKKQVGLSYHIRKSAEKGCLPPQEVPSSKRVLFDKYFTVKAKFTHVNHKIQKDKILKIDLMVCCFVLPAFHLLVNTHTGYIIEESPWYC